MRSWKRGLATAAFGAVAAALISLSMLPIPEQPVFAQTAGPPPPCGGPGQPPCATIPLAPGTEITPLGTGLQAWVPIANTVLGFEGVNGPIRVEIRDVVAPVMIELQATSNSLTATDANGNALVVTETAPGVYQVSQPS